MNLFFKYFYMKKKTLIVMAWAYFAWIAAAMLYNSKSKEEIKSELVEAKEKNEPQFNVFLRNFILVNRNLVDKVTSTYLTEEVKEKLEKNFDEYKDKADDIYKEYKEKALEYGKEWIEKFEKFYNEKLLEIETLNKKAPTYIEEVKQKLLDKYESFKNEINKDKE